MKTMIEKFHESEYGKNPDYCIAFYLGILCSIISQRDHRIYVDKFIKEGLINFRKFEDMKKLYIAIERFLFDDGESKVYREKVSNYFLQTTGENFDPDTAVMILGVGMSIRNPLESVLTFSEATKKWGLGHSTLREAARNGRFQEGEIKKSGSTWLVTYEAMKRLYGEPKGGKNMQYYRKNNTFIVQNGWKWANDYTFDDTTNEYEVGTVVCQSTEEWLAQGYEQVDIQELIDELEARGYDAEEILGD